jgi:hypothetical protein
MGYHSRQETERFAPQRPLLYGRESPCYDLFSLELTRIIHDDVYCNRRYAAATSLDAV